MEPHRLNAGGAVMAGVLVPAAVLTAARIAHPTIGPSVMLEAFTPYAVPLYTVALLVSLLVFRRKALLGCLAVALALHLWWVAPPFFGNSAKAGPNTFTLMTSNLMMGRATPASLMKAIVHEDVDVLVVEELGYYQYLELQKRGISEALPHHSQQSVKWLQGTVVFSRYPLSGETVLDLPLDGQRVTVSTPGAPLTLLAVHSRRAHGGGSDGWVVDHSTILAAARAAKGAVVIAGDFNASHDHAPIRRLEGAGYYDTADLVGAGWQPTWPSDRKVTLLLIPIPPLFRIDHVLVDAKVRVSDSRTRMIEGTDHRAVVAELTVG
jgi:endonuclease/exonuclease/phosphatase (EEP) superfamily protein YafD